MSSGPPESSENTLPAANASSSTTSTTSYIPLAEIAKYGVLFTSIVRTALAVQLALEAGDDVVSFDVLEQGAEEPKTASFDQARNGSLKTAGEQATALKKAEPGVEVLLLEWRDGPTDGYVRWVALRNEGKDVVLQTGHATGVPVAEGRYFHQHLEALVRRTLQQTRTGDVPLKELVEVSQEEQEELVRISQSQTEDGFVDAYPGAKLLQDFFLRTRATQPDAPAVVFDDLVLSYAQVDYLAQYLASKVTDAFFSASSEDAASTSPVILLHLTKSPALIPSILASLYAGAAYLSLEPSLPEARKTGIFGELSGDIGKAAGIRVVGLLADSEDWSPVLEGKEARLSTLQPLELLEPLFAAVRAEPTVCLASKFPLATSSAPPTKPTDPAYIIYTSGSTGTPKGIMVQHQNVAAFLRNYRGVFGREVGERVLQFPSYGFDVVVMNIWDTFAHGATLCMTSQSNLLSDLAGSIIRLGITLIDLTPTVSSVLFEHPEAQPTSDSETPKEAWERAGFRIKQVNTGGEKVEGWIIQKWRERGVRVAIDYGPTETTVGVISHEIPLEKAATLGAAPVTIGRPTGTTAVFILSQELELQPWGAVGEICVAGKQVTPGYVKKALNEGVFVEHPKFGRVYRTGDLGRFVGDQNEILCLGRKDSQVKVNGLRIEIGEIEKHLGKRLDPQLQTGIVEKVNDSLGLVAFVLLSEKRSMFKHKDVAGKDVVCALEMEDDRAFKAWVAQLREKLAEHLPQYMVPRYWVAVNRIPTQGMGKADRKTLRALAKEHDFWSRSGPASSEHVDREYQYEEEVYSDAVTAWSGVLDKAAGDLRPSDSFVRLGGDSIGFLKVIATLRRQGYTVSFQDLANVETLGDCAELLTRHRAALSTADAANGKPYQPFSLLSDSSRTALLAQLSSEYSIREEAVEDAYTTTPSQLALVAPSLGNSQYYAHAVYTVDPSLDPDTLVHALRQLVARTPLMRTVFVIADQEEEIVQAVLSAESSQVKEQLKRISATKVINGSVEDHVNSYLDRCSDEKLFQFGELLVDFFVFYAHGVCKLVWSAHHSLSDGWTLELLTADIRGLCYNLPLQPRPSFPLFAEAWKKRTVSDQTAEFWKQLAKPAAEGRRWPRSSSPASDLSTTSVHAAHWHGDFSVLAKEHGITPAIATRVACCVAIALVLGTTEVTVGVVRSGRDIAVSDCEDLIGPCVSVLPSSVNLEHDTSLLALLKDEASFDKAARLHQMISVPEILKLCGFVKRSELYNTLVTYQSLAQHEPDFEKAAPWPFRQPPEQIRMPSSYALSFEFTPSRTPGEAMEVSCFFDPGSIATEQASELVRRTNEVLDLMAASPETTLNALLPRHVANGHSKTNGRSSTNDSKESSADLSNAKEYIQPLRTAWSTVLKIKEDHIPVDEPFTALGGDSIAAIRLSARLTKAGIPIQVSRLSSLPTINAQALYLLAQQASPHK